MRDNQNLKQSFLSSDSVVITDLSSSKALFYFFFPTKQCFFSDHQSGTLKGEYDPSSSHILLHGSQLLLPELLFLSLVLLAV